MALSAKVSESYIAQRIVELADLPTAHKLQAAFKTVTADCAILRTRMIQVPGRGLVQVVGKGQIAWNSSKSVQ